MINLLPKEQKKALKHEYEIRLFSVICLAVAILGIFATILILPSYFFSNSKEVLVEKSLEDFNRDNPEIKVADLDKVYTDINSKLKTLDSSWPNDILIDETFKDLLSTVPKGITVTQFLYNENADGGKLFEIHGQASDREVLQSFKTVLEQDARFKDIVLPISNFVKKTNIDFVLSFALK